MKIYLFFWPLYFYVVYKFILNVHVCDVKWSDVQVLLFVVLSPNTNTVQILYFEYLLHVFSIYG